MINPNTLGSFIGLIERCTDEKTQKQKAEMVLAELDRQRVPFSQKEQYRIRLQEVLKKVAPAVMAVSLINPLADYQQDFEAPKSVLHRPDTGIC